MARTGLFDWLYATSTTFDQVMTEITRKHDGDGVAAKKEMLDRIATADYELEMQTEGEQLEEQGPLKAP